MSNDFIIYVTGDAGRDVFTYSLEERRPARLPRVHLLGSTEYDLHVPSGAAFASLVLKKLLEKPDSAIKIELLARFGLENPENKIEQALRPFLGTCAGRHSTGQPDDETEQELTPLPPILTHVKQQYEKSSGTDKKNRIGEFNRFIPGQRNESETSRCNFSSIASTDMARQLLIIHDGGAGWSTFSDTTKLTNLMHTFSQSLSQPLKESWQGLPRILVNISKKLPELGEKGAKTESQFQSMFWNQLQACKDRVGIVVSLSTLRRAGAAISRRLSWEQTVEDLAAELHLFPPLQALTWIFHKQEL
jgi:hypothetical protein